MLMQPPPTAQGLSRPFVVGLVMLLLFLSLQTDWGSVKQQGGSRHADLRQLGFAAAPEAAELSTTREKIIYELSVTLDKLERENWQLRQHILDLRRGMRKEGCELNGTLFTFPDVDTWLSSLDDRQRPEPEHRAKATGLQHAQQSTVSEARDPGEKGPALTRHKAGGHAGIQRLRGTTERSAGDAARD